MEQMILKAVTTATEEGTFEAVISTSSIDREKDIVSPAGMVRAIQKWASTGKKIPLAWNHSGDPDLQIGFIDPHSAKQVGAEVQVSGWIDRSIDAGAHAWRLVKTGTLGFSFGYLILQGTNRKGGGRNIDELDVFEATATPTPMNNDTRILSYKAVKQLVSVTRDLLEQAGRERFGSSQDDTDVWVDDFDPAGDWVVYCVSGDTEMQYMRVTYSMNAEATAAVLADGSTEVTRTTSYEPVDADAAEAQRILDASKSVDVTGKETKSRPVDPLRARADAIALEFASDGESRRKPPARKDAPKPAPMLTLEQLRQRTRDETLIALSGVDDI